MMTLLTQNMLQKYVSIDRLILLGIFNPFRIPMQASGPALSMQSRSQYSFLMQWFGISHYSSDCYNERE
jgi:hypothetical protein